MTAKAALLEKRFRISTDRINGLVLLVNSHTELQSKTLFGESSGARADILRAVVVFLHATFEVALNSLVPPNRSVRFSGRTDLDKALTLSGIDATPFRYFYPPLTQMAKRRHRIVHEADLLRGEAHDWSAADDWQLIMWLMAVPAFYYQLRISLGAATAAERVMHKQLRTAMTSHVAFGKQLVALPEVPEELRLQALQEIKTALENMSSTIRGSG